MPCSAQVCSQCMECTSCHLPLKGVQLGPCRKKRERTCLIYQIVNKDGKWKPTPGKRCIPAPVLPTRSSITVLSRPSHSAKAASSAVTSAVTSTSPPSTTDGEIPSTRPTTADPELEPPYASVRYGPADFSVKGIMKMTWDGLFMLGPRGWERLAAPNYGYSQAYQSHPHVHPPQAYAYMPQPVANQYRPQYVSPIHNPIPYTPQSYLPAQNGGSNPGYLIPGAIAPAFQQPHSTHYLGYPSHPPDRQPNSSTRREQSIHPNNQISIPNNSSHQSIPIHTQSQSTVIHSDPVMSSPRWQRSCRLPTINHSSRTLPVSVPRIAQRTHTPEAQLNTPWPALPRPGTFVKGSLNPSDSVKMAPAPKRSQPSRITKTIASTSFPKTSSIKPAMDLSRLQSQNSAMQKLCTEKESAKESSSAATPTPTPLIPRFPPNVDDLDRLVLRVEKKATKDEIRAAYWAREYEYHPLRHKTESLGARLEWQNRLRRAGEAADRLLGEKLGWEWPDDELEALLDMSNIEDQKHAGNVAEELRSADVDAGQPRQAKRKAEDAPEDTTDDRVTEIIGRLRGGYGERPAKRHRGDIHDELPCEADKVDGELWSNQLQGAADLSSSPNAGSLEL